jgi:hypothetical protein
MLHLTMILCDVILVANCNPLLGNHWSVTACDALSGKHHKCDLSGQQLAAILCLGVNGDVQSTLDEQTLTNLYNTAEAALVGWPKECRPIP